MVEERWCHSNWIALAELNDLNYQNSFEMIQQCNFIQYSNSQLSSQVVHSAGNNIKENGFNFMACQQLVAFHYKVNTTVKSKYMLLGSSLMFEFIYTVFSTCTRILTCFYDLRNKSLTVIEHYYSDGERISSQRK